MAQIKPIVTDEVYVHSPILSPLLPPGTYAPISISIWRAIGRSELLAASQITYRVDTNAIERADFSCTC